VARRRCAPRWRQQGSYRRCYGPNLALGSRSRADAAAVSAIAIKAQHDESDEPPDGTLTVGVGTDELGHVADGRGLGLDLSTFGAIRRSVSPPSAHAKMKEAPPASIPPDGRKSRPGAVRGPARAFSAPVPTPDGLGDDSAWSIDHVPCRRRCQQTARPGRGAAPGWPRPSRVPAFPQPIIAVALGLPSFVIRGAELVLKVTAPSRPWWVGREKVEGPLAPTACRGR
jgi:hypothetical protein